MGLLDRILGKDEPAQAQPQGPQPGANAEQGRGRVYGQTEDEQALARYRYMLKTAPPETIEQAHAEAFARLTPEQRRLLLEQLRDAAPAAERAAADRAGDDPQALARLATRTELRQPGFMERSFGRASATPGWGTAPGYAGGAPGAAPGFGGGMGSGFGGMMAGSLLGSIAGTVVGSMIAQQFFSHHGTPDGLMGGSGAGVFDAGHHDTTANSSLDSSDHATGTGNDAQDSGDYASGTGNDWDNDGGLAGDSGLADGGDFADGGDMGDIGDIGSIDI